MKVASNFRCIALRITLCAVFVVLCYRFEWRPLLFLTSECVLQFSRLLGIPMQRISLAVIHSASTQFVFSAPCTFIDVFAGAVPLIWQTATAFLHNLARLAVFACALFAFNILRLEIGHVLFEKGWPWILVHDGVGGVAYFMVWLWISRSALRHFGFANPVRETANYWVKVASNVDGRAV